MLRTDPTLLVIEDASDHAALIRVAARRAFPRLDVRVAGDGREGIAYLRGQAPFQHRGSHPFPNLVVLDLIMPEVDGFQVLEAMKEHREIRPVPVVVLTGSTDPTAEGRALALGAVAVYRKPDKLDDLGKLVAEIVTNYLPQKEVSAARPRAQ